MSLLSEVRGSTGVFGYQRGEEEGEDSPVLLFDWSTWPQATRERFVSELFEDLEESAPFLEFSSSGVRWRADSGLVPFGFSHVDEESASEWADAIEEGNQVDWWPQFDELLIIDQRALRDGDERGAPIWAVAVDGVALSDDYDDPKHANFAALDLQDAPSDEEE